VRQDADVIARNDGRLQAAGRIERRLSLKPNRMASNKSVPTPASTTWMVTPTAERQQRYASRGAIIGRTTMTIGTMFAPSRCQSAQIRYDATVSTTKSTNARTFAGGRCRDG
jgi:hypothetical protein